MEFSIGDVEKLTGISKDRLRYYEEKRLIIPGRNEDNSYRVYDIEEILKLLGIQLYRAMDMSVKDIVLSGGVFIVRQNIVLRRRTNRNRARRTSARPPGRHKTCDGSPPSP